MNAFHTTAAKKLLACLNCCMNEDTPGLEGSMASLANHIATGNGISQAPPMVRGQAMASRHAPAPQTKTERLSTVKEIMVPAANGYPANM